MLCYILESENVKYCISILLLYSITLSYGQIHPCNKNIVFGNQALLEFNGGNIISKSIQFRSLEACASVSDNVTGQLLFYTDGVTVRDKDGNTLQNGDSLRGSETSTQGALILPHPSFPNNYLIFTTSDFISNNGGLYYSTVDMNLNNGLGGIVPNEKNVLLYANVTEGLTYTYNRDSTGYWVVVHERASNVFVSLEINKLGIGAKIQKTSIGKNWGKDELDRGNFMQIIKFNPDGTRLAASNFLIQPNLTSEVYLFDFDNCSGQFSNELIIEKLDRNTYGIAFSPNSKLLYIANVQFPSQVLQIDLSQPTSSLINNSRTVVYTAPLAPVSQNRIVYMGGMQLYEDGKIYITESSRPFLHCINNPDQLGSACDFVPEKVKLITNTKSAYGLPQLVPKPVKNPKLIKDSFFIAINDTCLDRKEKATIVGIKEPFSIQWKFIDIAKQDTQIINDSAVVNLKKLVLGSYKIEAFIKKDCKMYYTFKNFTVKDCDCKGEIKVNTFCINKGTELSLNTTDAYSGIRWIIKDKAGNIIYNGSANSAKFKLDSGKQIFVMAIVEFNCKADTLTSKFDLFQCPVCTQLDIPTAFTPNKDGLNDAFLVTSICTVENYNIKIYNRWGQKVFDNNSINNFWDGTYLAKNCASGVYAYQISYRFAGSSQRSQNGTLTLLK